jgi:hypothetical protein
MNIPPEEILVTIEHPFGDVEMTLAEWMAKGPGPHPLLRLTNPRMKATGHPLPNDVISLAYQNTPPPLKNKRR